ncbi:MAG: hypothetical protein IJM79_02340 [Erysipelotrichaceae bacterium]|nr:hypothetical protein [Erysipelotrichaceae bacterium]
MKISYLTEDGLNTVRQNLKLVYKEVVKNGRCSISELFKDSSMVKYSALGCEDFSLDMSQPAGKESLTDIENIQRVYEHLKFLSDSQASDERIWAAMALNDYLEYMRYRWPAEDIKDVNNRYLFGYSVQRSLFRNGMARLWWIGRFTFDDKRQDPYELTEFLCSEQDFIESLCGRNIFNNPDVGQTVIAALCDAKNAGIEVNREKVRNVAKYLNMLGGTYILDCLSVEDIKAKVMKQLGE